MDARPFSISNADYAVELAPEAPCIVRCVRHGSDDVFHGDPERRPPLFTVLDVGRRLCLSTADGAVDARFTVSTGSNEAVYSTSLSASGRTAATLDLRFTLDAQGLTVGYRSCVELPGYRLIRLDMPMLLAVSAAEGWMRMALPLNGGRLIDPSRCAVGERQHRYDFMQDPFCNVAMLCGRHDTGVVTLGSFDDSLVSRVMEHGTARYAGIGVTLRHRYSPADREPDPFARFPFPGAGDDPPVEGSTRRATDDIIANDRSDVRIHLIHGGAERPERAWVPGARYANGLFGTGSSTAYDGAFVNKIFLGCPSSPHDTSFDEALDIIRRIHNRTDGARQICYLVGFQHDGHDTGYPDVFTANRHAGGHRKLLEAMREAERLNARVSFHDNYSDAYAGSASFSPDEIAVDPEGGLRKGGVWNGRRAYSVSIPRYMRGGAQERLRKTLEMYPVEETYHLDVLTAMLALDWRADAPADRDADIEAKLALAEEFRTRGLDLTSEACGSPFLGRMTYFWHLGRRGRSPYTGDSRIPLAAFIAHGRASYGGGGMEGNGVLDALLNGAFCSRDLKRETPLREILDSYYLVQVPLNRLRHRLMTGYDERGTWKSVSYADDTRVEVDFESMEHRVVIDGRTVVENYVSFAEGQRPGTYILYKSRMFDFMQEWRLPAQWRGASAVKAVPLLDDGDGEPFPLPVREGTLMVGMNVAEGTPYRISLP